MRLTDTMIEGLPRYDGAASSIEEEDFLDPESFDPETNFEDLDELRSARAIVGFSVVTQFFDSSDSSIGVVESDLTFEGRVLEVTDSGETDPSLQIARLEIIGAVDYMDAEGEAYRLNPEEVARMGSRLLVMNEVDGMSVCTIPAWQINPEYENRKS